MKVINCLKSHLGSQWLTSEKGEVSSGVVGAGCLEEQVFVESRRGKQDTCLGATGCCREQLEIRRSLVFFLQEVLFSHCLTGPAFYLYCPYASYISLNQLTFLSIYMFVAVLFKVYYGKIYKT